MSQSPGIPRNEYLSSLPTGARAILDAARQRLKEAGFDGLSMETVAAEAGQNKAMIRYHFGDKAGLVAALVDSLIHDAQLAMIEETELLPPGSDRLDLWFAGFQAMVEDRESFQALFDVVPHALRSEDLRGRVLELYRWYRGLNAEVFGAGGEGGGDVSALAALMTAAVDGLALQALLDEDFDPRPSLQMLEFLIGSCLPDLRKGEWSCERCAGPELSRRRPDLP